MYYFVSPSGIIDDKKAFLVSLKTKIDQFKKYVLVSPNEKIDQSKNVLFCITERNNRFFKTKYF